MLGMRCGHPGEKSGERVALGGQPYCGEGDSLRPVKPGKKDFIGSGLLYFRVPQTPVVCIPLLEVFAVFTCSRIYRWCTLNAFTF